MSDDDAPASPVPVPPGLDGEEAEAFRAGWTAAMMTVSGATREWANQSGADPFEGAGEPDEDECPECGGGLVRAMGHDGPVCPTCGP